MTILEIKETFATPFIINGVFSPTYENSGGFSIWFLFVNLGA
jgi:hypothetical protein